MRNKRVIIVGGGTAGWFAAAWLSKYYGKDNHNSITVIESPSIPKIGVGESVTAHVEGFFQELGIPTHHWMKHTGSIYKFGNKFVDWKHGQGEFEYFGFNFTVPASNFYRDITPATNIDEWASDPTELRNIDYAFDLCNRGIFSRFDQCFHPHFHYMEKNVSAFNNGKLLFNGPFSYAQHISAELAGTYIKDHYAIPNGVEHIVDTVVDIEHHGNTISNLTLKNGDIIEGDLFIDCTGFSKVLVKKLGWEEHVYENNPVDRAWVCQTDYTDIEKEMVNYTQSIAEPHGWRFAIGLYNRMGNGYCFSGKHISDEEALDHFITKIGPQRRTPKLIKWTPSRLQQFGAGNVAAVGLSGGFVEPMEANSLGIIINSIRRLGDVLSQGDPNVFNWDSYNKKMSIFFDNIADFILVHYTLSSRQDTNFWRDMVQLGKDKNHQKWLWDLYRTRENCIIQFSRRENCMHNIINGDNFFPDFMWIQLASGWGIPKLDEPELDATTQLLAEKHFLHVESKHKLISESRQNNFQWLKENIFDNLTPEEWENQFIKN